MDNLTHSLFGLTLARTPLGRAGRGVTATLLLASNAPDIDIVTTAGGASTYLEWHRGPTHGPLGVIALGLATAGIVVLARRWFDDSRDPRPASFGALTLVAMVGVLCHIFMDLPTSYGTRLLSPFSWTWFTEDWLPIVDVYLLAILGATLWFGRTAPSRNAVLALALMCLDYGLRATLHHRALTAAPAAFGAQLPERCHDAVAPGAPIDWWPRPALAAPRDRSVRRCVIEIAALPDFVSPFRWRLIAQLPQGYEVRMIDLLNRGHVPSSNVRMLSIHYPNNWTPAVLKAAHASVARTFLGFSRFPAARSFLDADGAATVSWTDLRFIVTDSPANPRQRLPGFFGATIRIGEHGAILSERMGS